MRRVLHEYKLTGVKTTSVICVPSWILLIFVEGHYDTGFIAKNSEFLQQRITRTRYSENIALIAAYID